MSSLNTQRTVEILLVEDNPGDADLTREGVEDSKFPSRLHVVENGEEAMWFLRRRAPYADSPRPDLILLDLNLPRRDGREFLKEMKADPDLRRIPVVVLTTSQAEEDVVKCYDLHANCYFRKPLKLDHFLSIVRSINDYWFTNVTLPPR
jgi:chemotaxis family two-component system response regulator Rcp1